MFGFGASQDEKGEVQCRYVPVISHLVLTNHIYLNGRLLRLVFNCSMVRIDGKGFPTFNANNAHHSISLK